MSEEHVLQIISWAMIVIVIIVGLAFSIKHDYIGEQMFEFIQEHYTEEAYKLAILIIGILFIVLGVMMLLYKIEFFGTW
jgi:spore maturation protein SpmA